MADVPNWQAPEPLLSRERGRAVGRVRRLPAATVGQGRAQQAGSGAPLEGAGVDLEGPGNGAEDVLRRRACPAQPGSRGPGQDGDGPGTVARRAQPPRRPYDGEGTSEQRVG